MALSLVALGSGYYYAGARWRLVWLAVAFPLLLAAIALLARFTVWIWAPFLLLTPFVCIDGLLQARRPDARRPPWLEMCGTLVLCLVYFTGMSVAFRQFVFEPFRVPAASMAPTLLPGDYILVDKLAYRAAGPQRGDIVVFGMPDDRTVSYVKRVIGLPGETVSFTAAGEVEIDGSPQPQQRVGEYAYDGRTYALTTEQLAERRAYPLLRAESARTWGDRMWSVPSDAYFMLGDNRENSKDSRYWRNSFVPRDDILGRVVRRHWSADPQTGQPRLDRIGPVEEASAASETPQAAAP